MGHRLKMLMPLITVLLIGTLFAAGCGSAVKVATTGAKSSTGSGIETSTHSDELEESISNVGERTPEEKNAACEALRYAEDANTGSVFEASDIKVCDGWARVAVEQTDVPVDEAVGFLVYLRRGDSDTWEVAETGTDITPDKLPGAPLEIFKSE
jgi:hypothetical protein